MNDLKYIYAPRVQPQNITYKAVPFHNPKNISMPLGYNPKISHIRLYPFKTQKKSLDHPDSSFHTLIFINLLQF